MPGFESHYFFGQEMIPLYPAKLQNTLKKYPKSYQIGLQGPDIFFYCISAYFTSEKNIGNIMHNHGTWAFFDACLTVRKRVISQKVKEIIDAYLLGFMCHYTLDTVCHPYIYYRTKHMEHQNRESYDFGIHVFLETDIDNALIRHFTHREPSQFKPWKTIELTAVEVRVITCFLYRVFSIAYPEHEIRKSLITNALKSMAIGQKLLNDPFGRKKLIARKIEERFFGHAIISSMVPNDHFQKYTDPLNLNHHQWHNPWDPSQRSTEDFFELLSRSQEIMKRRGQLLDNPLSLLEDLSDCSYLSGLPL